MLILFSFAPVNQTLINEKSNIISSFQSIEKLVSNGMNSIKK